MSISIVLLAGETLIRGSIVLIDLSERGSIRCGTRGPWCSSQSNEQMRAACSRSRVGIGLLGLIDGRDIIRGSDAQSLDVGAFAARSKARVGYPETAHIVEGVVRWISHLSKTASVETHIDLELCMYGKAAGDLWVKVNPGESAIRPTPQYLPGRQRLA